MEELAAGIQKVSEMAETLPTTIPTLLIFHSVVTAVALVGIGYSAIAAHRRERSAVLVLAWIPSVLAVFYDVGSIPYALAMAR